LGLGVPDPRTTAKDLAFRGALFEGAASLLRGQFSGMVYTDEMPGFTNAFSRDWLYLSWDSAKGAANKIHSKIKNTSCTLFLSMLCHLTFQKYWLN